MRPFEGSYFNPEKPNSKIEIIDDGYAERLLAKQMESMIEEAISQVAENYYIQGDIIIPEEWQDIPVEEISQWKNYVDHFISLLYYHINQNLFHLLIFLR